MNGHTGHSAGGVETEHATGQAYEYDRGRASGGPRRRATSPRSGNGSAPPPPDTPGFSMDAISLLRPASKRWYWVILAGIAGAVAGGAIGLYLWRPFYTATAQILSIQQSVGTDAYQPQRMSGHTLVGLMESPELFKRMGQKMNPPLAGSQVRGRIKVLPERQSDLVAIEASGPDAKSAIELANQFNAEVMDFTKSHQRKEAEQADAYVSDLLKDAQRDVEAARKALPSYIATLPMESRPAPVIANHLAEKLQVAREELAKELIKYTDIHPIVKQKRAEIAALEAGVPENLRNDPRLTSLAPTGRTERRAGPNEETFDEQQLAYHQLQTREALLRLLIDRQRAIQVFKNTPPGNFQIIQPATEDNVAMHSPTIRIGLLAAFFGTLGMIAAGAEILRREFFDNRLKTEGDVKRVTGLPVLATLGDIKTMSIDTQENWAFRTWIALQDRLAYSPNHGLICGITSSNSGDGRSTWIGLLAGAARKCGFRVLTIATRPTVDPVADEVTQDEPAEPAQAPHSSVAYAAGPEVEVEAPPVNGKHHRPATATAAATNGRTMTSPTDFAPPPTRGFAGESEFTSLTASALFTPAMVTEKLTGPETDPLVHIPLPGWTWNLERRKQWQGALNVWRKIDNVVILVELPPASMPESILLASNLPNLVWLVEAGKSEATSTRAQLETLRHARCNLVGTFINRALTRMTEGRFSRWVGCLALMTFLGMGQNQIFAAQANQADRLAMDVPAQFSVVSPTQRAAWQEKLTLGPGDIVNLGLYGEPLLLAEEVPVGPDGRISYLEAQNIVAAGLTVDEFRTKLNEELGRFRRAAQAYVIPVAYNSKKYFVLGKVTQGGVFTLDRPLTLIEAVARARGMETGIGTDRSLVEMADLSRSFVARNGRHLAVDFERLFLEGDLSQNIALEPNDYVYFPASAQKEVYVLGAVNSPGAYVYTSTTGALGAIAARGGFTDQAWKGRLLVIRGSLGRPQTFVVDAKEVLGAQKADLKLQPKDIVYVSERPWIRAEEILDAAASAFVTSAVVMWTGLHVNPVSIPTPR
jgi:protein involved in polysaccharide export with SLBB domain/capsular polysaccharide biosynthesis protein